MRQLSSSWTYTYRRVVPRLVLAGLVVALAAAAGAGPAARRLWEDRWLFLVAIAFGLCAYLYLFCARIVSVSLDGHWLVVSDFSREITVPLRDIDYVSGFFLTSPEIAWIHLKVDSEFGRKLVFRPKCWLRFSRHPVVEELNGLARLAQRRAA